MEIDKSFIDRMNKCADLAGNVSALAKLSGVSQSGMRNYFLGGEPTRKVLTSIANAAGVSIAWLATGEGPMHPGEPERTPAAKTSQSECHIDKSIMTMAVEIFEQGLEGHNIRMLPGQKADFIASYYQLLSGAKDEAARNDIKNQIKDIMRTTMAVVKA